jgi:hypothetical protein
MNESKKTKEANRTVANINVELYIESGCYCAYIGDDAGGSGIKVEGNTAEELADNMKSYILDYF